MENEVYVGLDYHDGSVQVSVIDASGEQLANRSYANNWAVIADAANKHGRVRRAAIECCSGAANLTQELAARAGWSVDMAHPGYVARMKQSPDKTDFGDARLLADLTRVGYLPRVWLAPEYIRELRTLVRHRQTLADEARACRLRIGSLLREHRVRPDEKMRRWGAAWMRWVKTATLPEHSRWVADQHLSNLQRLSEMIAQTEARLHKATADDPAVAALRRQKGIGPITAWVMRAMIGRFDRFTNGKQLARFCGVTPRNASSGQRVADAGMIKAGDPLLRTMLIEAAHRLGMHDDRWKALRGKMRAEGKHGSVIAAAIANRWMRGLYYKMKEVGEQLVHKETQAGTQPVTAQPAA
jgi:transposase